ncbi:hypothetical protein [Pannonibacter tanglangensis]|uniref:Uncharacterized protein n=1 Tax=Pannonibacter tanglangensis TaxID=2750084 RepID=A0ABW9ZB46_9HYPH|nr:hypothetical protein [Pannonibacter sp. XCT-34]NBN62060.1 hypothetical protein [Pannonibacter sp. XCT-34]
MADISHSPAGTGEAIPALYRRYLDACNAIERRTNFPTARQEADLADALDALAGATADTLADLVVLAEVYRRTANRPDGPSPWREDRLFNALHRSIRKLANRPIAGDGLTENQRRALSILQVHHRAGKGAPVAMKDWHGAYADWHKSANGTQVKHRSFVLVIRTLIRKSYVQERDWDHFVPLV